MEHRPIDPSEDSGTQMNRLAESINRSIKLTEELKVIGGFYNLAQIDVLKAKTKEERDKAKIREKELQGQYKRKQEEIKCEDKVTSGLKYMIKAEKNQF